MPVKQPSALSRQPSGCRSKSGRSQQWLRLFASFIAQVSCFWLLSCYDRPDRDTLVMIIESSPTNLDPRVGIDGPSERIDGLLFENLMNRDEHLSVRPELAERFEHPDPRTYIFHLRLALRLSYGQVLSLLDVKWVFDALMTGNIR